MDLKNFDLEHWWKLLAAAGIVIVVAGVAARFAPAILLGLGLLLIGLAEWAQRPRVTLPAQSFGLPLGIVTTHNRVFKPAALAAELVGGAVAIAGVVKLLLA